MSLKVCKFTGVFKKRMLEVIKKTTRYQQLNVISYSLINSYLSDEHISTFNSSPESRRPPVS